MAELEDVPTSPTEETTTPKEEEEVDDNFFTRTTKKWPFKIDHAWAEFCAMLPGYARACTGEGWMHDTAMLLGALGWDGYQGRAEMVTPYFVASGTGQANVVLPVS